MDILKQYLCLTVILVVLGCLYQGPVCNKPYIQVGNDCCLDENTDNICDRDKPLTTTTIITTTTTLVKNIRIGKAAREFEDYPLKVTIPYEPAMRPDFSDITFKSQGDRDLSFYIFHVNKGTNATFFVKIPALSTEEETTIKMHYGGQALNRSDGYSTFDIFDDFDKLSDERWLVTVKPTEYSIEDGNLVIRRDTGGEFIWRPKSFAPKDMELIMKLANDGEEGGTLLETYLRWEKDEGDLFSFGYCYGRDDNGRWDFRLTTSRKNTDCCEGTKSTGRFYITSARMPDKNTIEVFDVSDELTGYTKRLSLMDPETTAEEGYNLNIDTWSGNQGQTSRIDYIIGKKTLYPDLEPTVTFD